jgi:hypothetical protein
LEVEFYLVTCIGKFVLTRKTSWLGLHVASWTPPPRSDGFGLFGKAWAGWDIVIVVITYHRHHRRRRWRLVCLISFGALMRDDCRGSRERAAWCLVVVAECVGGGCSRGGSMETYRCLRRTLDRVGIREWKVTGHGGTRLWLPHIAVCR